MAIETVRQQWENVHSAPQEAFRESVLDHGLSYHPKRDDVSLNYVSFKEWNRLSQDRQKKNWYRAMKDQAIYSAQDTELLEDHECEGEREMEMKKAIIWLLIYVIGLLFLNALGVSSVVELFF